MAPGGTHPTYRHTCHLSDGLLELSTGDNDVLAADLVLLRRAEA